MTTKKPLKICLTGGPSAGKTTVIEIIRREFADAAIAVPEAASILYKGGFPRSHAPEAIRSAQRAIYYCQIEMENWLSHQTEARLMFCDRGTLDHPAYWPEDSDESFFESVGTTLEAEIARYDFVIHLETCAQAAGYKGSDVRNESPSQALLVDQRILDNWSPHPRRVIVESRLAFHEKIAAVFEAIEKFLAENSIQIRVQPWRMNLVETQSERPRSSTPKNSWMENSERETSSRIHI